ncbi:hypothetical protein SETIT_4G141200v2 [Setaria italica]|uniref:Uncharacterized protein n=1 Tax=Setaria italica TaxID=4555 RepID=A0A368QU19_SETIT|nr:hypothetical protein SETIT_4G141200v2 [Setaria italica]
MVRGRRSVGFPKAASSSYRARVHAKKTEEAAHAWATPSRWHLVPPSLHPTRGSTSVVALFQSNSRLEVLKSMVLPTNQEHAVATEYARSSTKFLCGSVDKEQVDADKQDWVQLE